jgi:hypothetical protein
VPGCIGTRGAVAGWDSTSASQLSMDILWWSNNRPPHLPACSTTWHTCAACISAGCSSGAARWVAAVSVVFGLRLVAAQVDLRMRLTWPVHRTSSNQAATAAVEQSRGSPVKPPGSPRGSKQRRDHIAWRQHVGSELVATAWDKLCSSIIQEVSSYNPAVGCRHDITASCMALASA